jgi:hypothetical protein
MNDEMAFGIKHCMLIVQFSFAKGKEKIKQGIFIVMRHLDLF